jgi:[ribosomal protein S18]-alanine N-acetyltransferase
LWNLHPVAEADLSVLLDIEAACFDRPWNRDAFLDELAHRDAAGYLLRRSMPDATGAVGYICFRLLYYEMYIKKIAVTPQWRGQGLAARLLNHGMETATARGATAALLEVRPTNRPALGLYRRFGFHQIGRRKQYFSETGEDALVLMRHLKEDS